MSEITLRKQQYGSSMVLSEDLLKYAQFDVRAYAKQQLERQLLEAGATEGFKLEAEPFAESYDLPRRWWERLLRRPPRTYEMRGERFVAYGYGWVPE